MNVLYFLLLFSSCCFCSEVIGWFEQYNFGGKYKAIQAYQLKDYDQALMHLCKLIDQDPYNPEHNYNIGTVFYKQKKYKDAQNSFVRAAEKATLNVELQEQALFNAGNSFYQLEKWSQAVTYYEQVLKINKDNQSAQHNLQLALAQMQDKQNDDQLQKNQQEKQDRSAGDNQQKDQSCQEKSDPLQDSGEQQEKSNKGAPEKNFDEKDKKSQNGQGSQEKQSSDHGNQTGEQDGNQQEQKLNQGQSPENQKLDNSFDENISDHDKKQSQDKNKIADQSDQTDNQIDDESNIHSAEQDDKNEESIEERTTGLHKSELKNDFKADYEKKASDDERLDDYYASVMDALEKLEEKVQKHVLKSKVTMQKEVNQHGKKSW